MRFAGRLPSTVVIGGTECPIHTDFRSGIRFELLVQEEEEERKLLEGLLEIYYDGMILENMEEAIERALWFYRGGEPEEKKSRTGVERKRAYSFDIDWDYIYAAFLEQFRIDLQEVDYLHWWKFRAMFLSLSENSRFMEIMGYRSIKLNRKMPKEQKEFYKKMQKLYAIPASGKDAAKKSALEEALEKGESIEDLL